MQTNYKATQRRLDRSQNFGTISGVIDPIDGQAPTYEQNGILFGPDGMRLYASGEERLPDDEPAPKDASPSLDPDMGRAIAALKTMGYTIQPAGAQGAHVAPAIAPTPANTIAPNAPGTGDGLNLADWALGHVQVPFHKVRDAVKKRYGINANNKDQVLDTLVDNRVVSREQVDALYGKPNLSAQTPITQ